jgi:tetratricopeptide (TPR) repeat protein
MAVKEENASLETAPVDIEGGAKVPGPAQPVTPTPDFTVTEPPDDRSQVKTKRRQPWILWVMLGLLALALIAASSAYSGYRSAVRARTSFEATQIAGEAGNQFNLALTNITEGNYELAQQRLEYVIRLDPGFPGAKEKLAEVLLELRTTATPTTAPTSTLTPTPDLRGRDELYAQTLNYLASSDWTAAIDTALLLRKQYPDFKAVEIDGVLYIALRNRGVDKIALLADLEGGTYDLTLAGRFGPLDVEASNWRDWAELYIRGASFWDVDWAQAVYYFSQLALVAPNLRDGSGWTSTDRYIIALIKYGDWLVLQEEWCLAEEQYRLAYEYGRNPELEPTAVYAYEQCGGGEPDESPGETPTPGGLPVTIPSETPQPTPYP